MPDSDQRPTSVTDGITIPDLLAMPQGEHSLARRALWWLGAAGCFILGIVGWLVPVITGIPFYILGAVMLSKASPAVGWRINSWERGWTLKWRLMLRPTLRKEAQGRESGPSS
ncbi:MAG: hypothetical protein ACI9EF_001628 [Pseudohongiellaceae bacterium]|jgi:hypothetical protein